jgi:hypothetical protein
MKAAPGESLEIQALQTRALELWEIDKASALELGRALVAVRDAMQGEHGAFTRWWSDHDLDENRVYYCIRKAEGKIPATKEATLEFTLNERNLAVAGIAAKPGVASSGETFDPSTVYVGPLGTMATDGFVLARVSLPQGNANVPTENGLIPCETFTRLSPGDATHCLTVGFRRNGEIVTKSDQIETIIPPSKYQEFPNAEKLFAKFAEVDPMFECTFDIQHLATIVNALKKFEAKGRVVFQFNKNMVRATADSGDQQFTGLLTMMKPQKKENA